MTKIFATTAATLITALVLVNTTGCSDDSVSSDTQSEAATSDASNSLRDTPLAEQPKAMVDDAQNKVDEINRLNKEQMDDVNSL